MAVIRALVGSRVSNVQGAEKTSHITQRGKGEAYAESQGWTVVGAFEDLDVSAIKLSPLGASGPPGVADRSVETGTH